MKTVYLKVFSLIPYINLKSEHTAFFLCRFSSNFPYIFNFLIGHFFQLALSIIAGKYVNDEKNHEISVVKDKYFPDI